MLPSWLDSSPWSLLIEGGNLGVPYSYFINFKAFGDHYIFYITDLASIWTETCDAESIKSKLAPYENFLELSVQDLLRILTDMFGKPENISKLSLQPVAEEGLTVECGTQLGFVKFNWNFECKLVDRRLAAHYIRSKFTLPALLIAASHSGVADTNTKAITREQYQNFQGMKSVEKQRTTTETQTSPKVVSRPPPHSLSPMLSTSIPDNKPEKLGPSVEPPASAPLKVSPVDAELERRKQLESMLAANKAKANEKKRKLI